MSGIVNRITRKKDSFQENDILSQIEQEVLSKKVDFSENESFNKKPLNLEEELYGNVSKS